MRWRSLLLLFALLVGLGGLAWMRMEREREGVGIVPEVEPLLPGLAIDRVAAIRIDSLERAVQVRLERDARGQWFLTDPVAYPAAEGVPRAILRTLRDATAEAGEGLDPEEAGLAPPNAILEVLQKDPDGERHLRVALGATDLDPNRIYVRREGDAAGDQPDQVLLSTRTLASLLARSVDDYRSRRLTSLLGPDVIAVRREGKAFLEDRGRELDITLDAEQTGGGWRTRGERVMTLDPNGMGLLVTGVASLAARRFLDDEPEDLAVYGLDPPAFTIELVGQDGVRETLSFGTPPLVGPRQAAPDTWFCMRSGLPNVYEVDAEDVALLIRPVEDFFDAFLLRTRREEVVEVRLSQGEHALVLSREGTAWTVRAGPEDAPRYPAADGAVEDLLAKIEQTELALPDGLEFTEVEPARRLEILTTTGQRFGGRLGGPARDPTLGLEGVAFLRFGDNVPALLDGAVAELFERDAASFRSDRVHRIRPEDLSAVTLTQGGTVRTYRHPTDKDWFVGQTRFVAPKALRNSLFTLLALRAEAWLDPDSTESLVQPIDVRLEPRDGGEPITFTLGLDAEGRLLCREGEVLARVDSEQLAKHREAWGEEFFRALQSLFAEGGAGQ